jgi:hypothetical protein
MITATVANELISDHTRHARAHRGFRRESVFGRFRRRSGAPHPLVPRGRSAPPLAH